MALWKSCAAHSERSLKELAGANGLNKPPMTPAQSCDRLSPNFVQRDSRRAAEEHKGRRSGAMHLAVALDRPVVSVFGPTNPVHIGPYEAGAKEPSEQITRWRGPRSMATDST